MLCGEAVAALNTDAPIGKAATRARSWAARSRLAVFRACFMEGGLHRSAARGTRRRQRWPLG